MPLTKAPTQYKFFNSLNQLSPESLSTTSSLWLFLLAILMRRLNDPTEFSADENYYLESNL